MNKKTLQHWVATFFLAFLTVLFLNPVTARSEADPSKPPAQSKSSFNTQVYEKDSSQKSFSATVKFVREMRGSWEVLFEGKAGIYAVEDSQQSLLVESQKSKTPVSVKVDEETMRVVSVQAPLQKASSPQNTTSSPTQNPLGK